MERRQPARGLASFLNRAARHFREEATSELPGHKAEMQEYLD
jgi:hypothetical protein